VCLGAEFPQRDRGTFLIPRFGQLLPVPADVGFDVVQVRLKGEREGRLHAEVKTFMPKVPRPVDICVGGGKIHIVEYTRQISGAGGEWVPGGLLEVSPLP
jgi:hypothetical protein